MKIKNKGKYEVRNKSITISFDVKVTEKNADLLDRISVLPFKIGERGNVQLKLANYAGTAFSNDALDTIMLANSSGENLKFHVERKFCKE